MSRVSVRAVWAAVVVAVVGLGVVAAATGNAGERRIEVLDACDPASFNGPGGPGPGTCNRPGGGVAFSEFIGQLMDEAGRRPGASLPDS
jgi:hypothetical protein